MTRQPPHQPRHLAQFDEYGNPLDFFVRSPERSVDFWRWQQAAQRPQSWLGSRVMLRQAREPDLHPHNATEATP